LLECRGVLFDASYRFIRTTTCSRKWLKLSEIKKLFNACEPGKAGDLNRAILSLYYGLGLRRMEGVGLDMADIQWNEGYVIIRNAKFKRERIVPMNHQVQKDIEAYMVRYRRPWLKIVGKTHEPALLISNQGNRLSGAGVYERLQRIAAKAQIKVPLALHTLRHSIATHLLENGLDMEHIGSFLGHMSLESTQIYTHLVHNNRYEKRIC
jgi:integrase/recombinase XerD